MSWWEEHVSPVLLRSETAGAMGAMIGFLSAPGGTWRQQLFNLTAGLGLAVYTGPWVAEQLSVESPTGQRAFSFVLGTVGMNLLAKAILISKEVDVLVLVSNLPVFLKNWRKPPSQGDE